MTSPDHGDVSDPPATAPRVAIIIATVGRAALAGKTVEYLKNQTFDVSRILVVGACDEDVAGICDIVSDCETIITSKGLCRQRNAGLDAIGTDCDYVFFFDDDFLPAPDFVANAVSIFEADDRISGVSGRLIADGINCGGIAFEDGVRLIENAPDRVWKAGTRKGLYGCNMALRVSMIDDLRFDENLPLYGWQEDIDFTVRLSRKGPLVDNTAVTGVHLGYSGGRTSGLRLGYSQVANIIYLNRKGTMVPRLAKKLLVGNVLSNIVKSIRPEPTIDRRGRLKGNILALADLIRGRLDPRRIERM